MRPGSTCPAHSRSARNSLFSSRDADGTHHAARCVSNRSALQWRLQRAAFWGAECSGDFQGTEERSVVGVPHPYPEQFAARCIMFRSYAKPPRNIRENCCALLRACQGPLGEPDAPFPRSRNVLVPNGFPRITCRQSAAGTVLCPTFPAVLQPSAYSKPSSCLRSWGGGKRASYGGVDMPLMLRAQRPRRLRAAPRRSRSRRSPPAGHTTG